MKQVLQPGVWARPKGYANGVAVRGRQVYVAGMIGWDGHKMSKSRGNLVLVSRLRALPASRRLSFSRAI